MRFILIIAFCYLFTFSYSQEKSLYERKKEQIDIEYIKEAMGPFYNQETIEQARKNGSLDELKRKWRIIWKIEKQYKLEMKFASKYKEATKLMNKQEKDNLAKIKNKELLSKTDYGIMLEEIKNNINGWLNKDEFEKTDDYINRIKQDGEFEIQKIIKNTISNYTNKKKERLRIRLESYDADKERYYVLIPTQTDEFSIKYITNANSYNAKILSSVYDNKYYHSLTINNEDWAFYENYWMPRQLVMKTNTSQSYTQDGVEKYYENATFNITIRYPEYIIKRIINKSTLEIKNQYLKDFEFSL